MSGHPSRRWIGLGEAAPHPLGAAYREGEVDKGGSCLQEGAISLGAARTSFARQSAGGQNPAIQEFFPGRGRVGNTMSAPLPRDTLTAVGKNSRVASLPKGETSVLRGAGQKAIENRNAQASSLVGGRGAGGAGFKSQLSCFLAV